MEVDLEEGVEQRVFQAGQQLQRLERLQRADHARRRAEDAGLGQLGTEPGGGGSGNAQRGGRDAGRIAITSPASLMMPPSRAGSAPRSRPR